MSLAAIIDDVLRPALVEEFGPERTDEFLGRNRPRLLEIVAEYRDILEPAANSGTAAEPPDPPYDPSRFATLDRRASQILDALTAGLPVGEARKIENSKGYMAVHVERLSEWQFSIAHYGEANGDLVADPDVVFLRLRAKHGRTAGVWTPVEITQGWVGRYTSVLEFDDAGSVRVTDVYNARDIASFANDWMRNIESQQGVL